MKNGAPQSIGRAESRIINNRCCFRKSDDYSEHRIHYDNCKLTDEAKSMVNSWTDDHFSRLWDIDNYDH
jgi:hypothetical protein